MQAEIVRITRDASGLEPTDVHCPARVPLHAGDVSTCAAPLDGQLVTYEVRGGFVVINTIQKTLAQRGGDNTGTTVGATCADGKKADTLSVTATVSYDKGTVDVS